MLYLCKKVRIMFQDNEYIGFVTYTQWAKGTEKFLLV